MVDDGAKARPKVLVLASTYPRWSGDPEPAFVHELCRRLARSSDVAVICPSAPGTPSGERMDGVWVRRFRYAPRKLETLVNDGGITTNLRRRPWKYLHVPVFVFSMFVSTVHALWRWRPDVIHAHWLIPQGLVAVLARTVMRGRVRLVVTSHGVDLYGWKRWPFSWLKRWVIRKADAVTVVSSAMVKEVLALAPMAVEPKVLPMGVDLQQRFSPDPAVARIPGRILFVGRLVEKKGLPHLLAAMPAILAHVPHATLTVVGFGPDEAICRQLVAAKGLDGAVEFTGALPQDALPFQYRSAEVFVAPFTEAANGDKDGLGLVLVEAAACGCPVVVGDIPATHDVFGAEEALFVHPADKDGLAAAVASVLMGTARLLPPTKAGLEAKFDWDKVAARYEALLVPGAAGGH